jgi:AraC-like DNA-binding protein
MTVHANTLIIRASVPSGGIRAWVDAFERLGYPRGALLAAAHVSPERLEDPDGRLPCEVYGAIAECALRLRPTKNLGMQLAHVTPMGAYPLLDYLVLTSDTVGAGIEQLARYFGLVAAPTVLRLVEESARTTVVFDSGGIDLAVEYSIALLVFHLRAETAGAFVPERVDLEAIPDDREELVRAFGCPVTPGAPSNRVVVSRSTLELPLARRDPALQAVLEEHPAAGAADARLRNGLPDDVLGVLTIRVNGGDVRIDAVARELAIAPRSLQRKLAEKGVTYHSLVERARCTAAERHLADRRLSVSEIAYLLGYSEPAAFHRAFKRWHGVSPQAFRAATPGA